MIFTRTGRPMPGALDSVRQAEVCAATRGHGTNETSHSLRPSFAS